MENQKVQSSQIPKTVEVFPTKDVFMRKNITEVEDEDGKHFEYDEVFFISDATQEEIEADFETFYQLGKEYNPHPTQKPTWQDWAEAQMTYTAVMTGTLINQ